MTLSDYIIFTTVSELKNMSLASDKLYLTRSAISHAISRIEREIGFPLFIKNTHGIELTDNGAALLPLAYAVIQNHQHFNEKSLRSMVWPLAMSALEPAPVSVLTGSLNL